MSAPPAPTGYAAPNAPFDPTKAQPHKWYRKPVLIGSVAAAALLLAGAGIGFSIGANTGSHSDLASNNTSISDDSGVVPGDSAVEPGDGPASGQTRSNGGGPRGTEGGLPGGPHGAPVGAPVTPTDIPTDAPSTPIS